MVDVGLAAMVVIRAMVEVGASGHGGDGGGTRYAIPYGRSPLADALCFMW